MYIMRLILLFISSLNFLYISAFTISGRTERVLQYIRDGYRTEAIELLKKTAATNDVVAQFYMGRCYEFGLGLIKNDQMAFSMYRRAAERGFPPAMKELARCYRTGTGVDRNSSRANEWENRYLSKKTDWDIPDIIEVFADNKVDSDRATTLTDDVAMTKTKNETSILKEPKVSTKGISQDFLDKAVSEVHNTEDVEDVRSDVDLDIPITNVRNERTFALIIANENYQDAALVMNALNDGEIFEKYCRLTLGLPTSNVKLVRNATLNNLKRELRLLKEISIASEGDASFIIYYSGHGLPDEKTRNAFLMPVDGFGSDLTTCLSLSDFYSAVGSLHCQKTIVILDACFSGSTRDNEMLYAARGVAIKPKRDVPKGNTVVLSSSQGDESSYSYDEKKHGLFTYFFLKKLKETRGDLTIGELIESIKKDVSLKSLLIQGRSQTPTAVPSLEIDEFWKKWTLN